MVFKLRKEILVVSLGAAIICVAYAMHMGQDINWDLLNYHIYGVFALFHDRAQLDIAPSQLQTWLNPFGEILQYLAIFHMLPVFGTIFLAGLASVTVTITYFIAKETLKKDAETSAPLRLLVCCLSTLGALVSPTFLSEVGTTFSDYLGDIFILMSLLIVIKKRFSFRGYIISGLMLGLALDIKLPNAAYIVGWIAAVFIIENRRSFYCLICSGLAALATYLPIGGIWNLYIYSIFKNPLFPMYNDVFKSPAYQPQPMLDGRFKPHSFSDALGYFAKLALGDHPTSELFFRDIRFLVALIIFVLVLPQLIFLFFSRDKDNALRPFSGKPSLFLLAFVVGSFAAWLSFFGIERYAIPLEQLAVLIILILLALLVGSNCSFPQTAIITVFAILITTKAPDFGHIPFKANWFDIQLPAELSDKQIMYVMVSDEPMSFVIPYFPALDAFVRVEGNMPLDPAIGLGHEALERVLSYQGQIRTLGPASALSETSLTQLRRFGLKPSDENCLKITSKAAILLSCPLVRYEL